MVSPILTTRTLEYHPARAPLLESLASFWRRGTQVERLAYVLGALLLLSGTVHAAILIASGASWNGPLSLRKAATFGAAFGLTLITMVWVTNFVRLGQRTRAVLLAAFSLACVSEVVLISMQAWRQVPSHFNVETPFNALVTRGLAVFGISLVVIILAFTVAAFRANPAVPASMRLAVRAGFASLFAAQIVGGLMIARGMTLVARGNAQAAYATGGMLKPTHGALMHGILVLPVIAWLLSFPDWSEARRLRMVVIAVASYFVVIAAVAAANLRGVDPLHPPPALAIPLALGACTLLVTCAIAIMVGLNGVNRGIQHP